MNIANYIQQSAIEAQAVAAEIARHKPRGGYSRTQELIDHIAQHGPVKTSALCETFDLEARQVWGMLNQPRKVGKVTTIAAGWVRSSDYDDRKTEKAVALLVARGWTCTPPGVKP